MNCDNTSNNFNKALPYNKTTSQKNKSAFIEKVISENFSLFKSNLNGNKSSKKSRSFLDDEQLKNLNSIFSNLSFETLKQTNEKLQLEKFRDKGSLDWQKKSANPNLKQQHYPYDGNYALIKKQLTTGDILTTDRSKLFKQHIGTQSAYTRLLPERATSADRKRAITNSSLTSTSNELSNNNKTNSLNTSSQIVIHVCDEAKRLKQDFMCPRDLLVKEMKYFSYNLNINVNNSSNSPQQQISGAHAHSSIPTSALSKKSLDEIDISVHCDINIFDWLMRYVKRNHPFLIEKTIASPADKAESPTNSIKTRSFEPKLEINNCVSILLSSDFLIMGELVDKCIVFIADHLESVLQIQCVLNGISEVIIAKLAACVSIERLDVIYDKKDKLKTKLFQRKIEFMFDVDKYRKQFEGSPILKYWRDEESLKKTGHECSSKIGDSPRSTETSHNQELSLNLDDVEYQNTNYNNFLYECENDASSLFKCKLCGKLMTKRQSENLKCHLAILDVYGNYIYLHVPDDTFDMTNFLQLLKDKLKTWQSVYWFLWALIKHFKCKKCNDWFRLTEFNRCRLNQTSFCSIHDIKISSSPQNTTNTSNDPSNKCTCIFINHVLESSSITELYSKAQIVTDQLASSLGAEQRLANYLDFILENLDKHNDIILHGFTQTPSNQTNLNNSGNELNEAIFFCDLIEELLKETSSDKPKQTQQQQQQQLQQTPASLYITKENTSFNKNLAKSPAVTSAVQSLPSSPVVQPSEVYESSFFIDSITGKHIALLSKHVLNLIKITQLANPNDDQSIVSKPTERITSNNYINAYSITPILNMSIDLKTYLYLINQIDVKNIFNTLDTFYFSRTSKCRWDSQKLTRLNQDNQREDDLNKFRDLSSYLIKTKLIDEHQKPVAHRSHIATLMMQQHNLSRMNSDTINFMTSNSSMGGIYCRVEREWQYKYNK